MSGVDGPVELLAALATLWEAGAPEGTTVQVGALPEVLPARLAAIAVGDYDNGGVSVEPNVDDMGGGIVAVYTVRCMVVVFDSSRNWRIAAEDAEEIAAALRRGIAADMSLGNLAIEAAMTGIQQWHIDPHSPDGGSAGVELAVQIVAQES